ncbi:MAG: DMT family transporter [Alphaproteobacteria bacterium]|nr:DMT family transporter [Alphaproteobacteria bacterium]
MTNADTAHASGDRPTAGIAIMCAAVALFAIQDTISKYLSAGYPAVEVAWFRYVSGVLAVLALLPWLGGKSAFRSRRPGQQILRGVMLYSSTVLFVAAIYYIPLPTATAIGFVSPLFLTALSIPFLGEKVGVRRWTAIFVGFLGVLIVVRPGFGGFQWPLLIPILMAAMYAVYQVVTRLIRDADPPITSLLYPSIVGCVLGFLPVPFLWVAPNLFDAGLLTLLGFCGTASHFCLVRAFALAPATTLAPFAYTQLLWVTILSYLFFGEIPDLPTAIGAAVIVASGLYVFYRERRVKGL